MKCAMFVPFRAPRRCGKPAAVAVAGKPVCAACAEMFCCAAEREAAVVVPPEAAGMAAHFAAKEAA